MIDIPHLKVPFEVVPATYSPLVVVTPGETFVDAVLADSPSLYWRLGEAVGTTAADASGNARTGTYTGSFTLGASGALTAIGDTDTAVDLTGLGGRITSGYNPFTNGTTRTFEGWAYRNTNASDDVLLGSSAAYPDAVILQIQAGSNAVLFFTAAGGYSLGFVPGTAQWFHWALVFNETANTAELYVNGISQGVVAQPDPYNAAPGNLQIGAFGAGSSPFDGKLDEFAVYETGLSAARILAHYQRGSSGPGPDTTTGGDLLVPASIQTVEQDSPEEISQCVDTILRTPVGSRIEMPEFGVPEKVFEQLPAGASAQDIERALERWEPRIDAVTQTEIDDAVERIRVRYQEVAGG